MAALYFKCEDKTGTAFLANDSIGLGSLAVGLGCDPMGITVGGISLDYNPATGQSQTFGAVLQHLRQRDELLGTCPEHPILLEGRALEDGGLAGPGIASTPAAAAHVTEVYEFLPDKTEGLAGRAYKAPRMSTIRNLLRFVAAVGLVVVNGPPMTGKTSLMQQLKEAARRAGWKAVYHITAAAGNKLSTVTSLIEEATAASNHPQTWTDLWGGSSPPTSGGGAGHSAPSNSYTASELVLVLIDEAQILFPDQPIQEASNPVSPQLSTPGPAQASNPQVLRDADFWNNMKALQSGQQRRTVRVLLNVLYGDAPSGVQSSTRAVSPMEFTQVVTFSVVSNKYGVRLALNRSDCEELWVEFMKKGGYGGLFNDPALREAVYELTAGHVGLLVSFLDRVDKKLHGVVRGADEATGDNVIRHMFQQGDVCLRMMEEVRGVVKDLKQLEKVQPFMEAIITAGPEGCSTEVLQEAWAFANPSASTSAVDQIDSLYRQGFIIKDPYTARYQLVSPLHYSYYLVQLRTRPYIQLEGGSLKQFVPFLRHTIQRMSAKALRQSLSRRQEGDPRVYERHYQVEWYKAAKTLLPDGAIMSPDVGRVYGCKGAIDFFILPSLSAQQGWGIELLVHGDRAVKHQERFAENGKYARMPCTESALLDFWSVTPNMTIEGNNYYTVVFEPDFQTARFIYPDKRTQTLTLLDL